MSTIDPIAVREARRARPPGLAGLGVLLVLLAAGGFGNGYGWSTLIVSVSASGDGDLPALAGVGAGVGLPLAILAFVGWAFRAPRRPGAHLMLAPLAFWLGAGAGALLAADRLDAPGLTVAGVACLALAACAGGLAVASARRRRRVRAREAETLRSGLRTTATVSDKGYVRFHESDRVLARVTFTFVDAQSIRRWVQRPVVVLAEDPVVEGQTTDLWYDPSDPGDDAKIVVGLARDAPQLLP